MKKYPKEFEKWWSRSSGRRRYSGVPGFENHVKRIAFNAWQKGRSYEKAYHDFPYNKDFGYDKPFRVRMYDE